MLIPIAIEEPPEELSKEERLIYKRVCDVECALCNKVYCSVSYDGNESINIVRKTKRLPEK